MRFPLIQSVRKPDKGWTDGMTKNYTSSVAFRFPIAFQLVLIVPIFVLSFIVPESPRWLANHGRPDESLSVVARLLGTSTSDPAAVEKYREIADAVAFEEKVAAKGWAEVFKKDAIGTRRRFFIACSVQFFQQLGGINGVICTSSWHFPIRARLTSCLRRL